MKIEDIIKSSNELEIEKKIMLNIIFTQNCVSERIGEILKPYDISQEQYNVLRILRGQKGKPSNMFTIQERMIAKTSNTTRLVDKLLIKDLVTREVCCNNRRKIEVQITRKGLEILANLDQKINENEKFFAKKLSADELEKLNYLLEKYRN
jgi:DNA-binding MarR family transcriptional regulator